MIEKHEYFGDCKCKCRNCAHLLPDCSCAEQGKTECLCDPKGTVEVDKTEFRTTLTIKPKHGENSEIQLIWGAGAFTNLQLVAFDRREKKTADFVIGNDDLRRYNEICEQYTGDILDNWAKVFEVDMPQLRKQKRKVTPKRKVVVEETDEVVEPKKKKARKIPKNVEQFKCEGCRDPYRMTKCVEFDDGAMLCPTCAGIRRAEEYNEAHPQPAEPEATQPKPNLFRWYILACAPTKETKVRRDIIRLAKDADVSRYIKRIKIATNKQVAMTYAGRVVRSKKSWNGYLIVHMMHCPETEAFLASKAVRGRGAFGLMPFRPTVTAAPGTKAHESQREDFLAWVPTELSQNEIDLILLRSDRSASLPKPVKLNYKVGDSVLINDGQYDGMLGEVTKIRGEKHDPQTSVMMQVLGQPIEVEVPHDHCQPLTPQLRKALGV
jgi:transcriptional antiterminator NusG